MCKNPTKPLLKSTEIGREMLPEELGKPPKEVAVVLSDQHHLWLRKRSPHQENNQTAAVFWGWPRCPLNILIALYSCLGMATVFRRDIEK